MPIIDDEVVISSGEGVLPRGAVLGKVTIGAATVASAAKTGGNTGNGTLTLDATTPLPGGHKEGIYTARVIRAAAAEVATTPAVPAQKAVAELVDPEGNVLAVFDVSGTVGTTVVNQVSFVMIEGDTPFVVGDGFDITVAVAAGSNEYRLVNSANTDGSDVLRCVLAVDVDATDNTVTAPVYLTGEFNSEALVFGGSDTAAMYRDAARALGIFFKSVR